MVLSISLQDEESASKTPTRTSSGPGGEESVSSLSDLSTHTQFCSQEAHFVERGNRKRVTTSSSSASSWPSCTSFLGLAPLSTVLLRDQTLRRSQASISGEQRADLKVGMTEEHFHPLSGVESNAIMSSPNTTLRLGRHSFMVYIHYPQTPHPSLFLFSWAPLFDFQQRYSDI